jgi:hypothetical protein
MENSQMTKAATKKTKTNGKAKNAQAKQPGVIAELINLLKSGGGTVEQLLAKLMKKFPGRGEAMKGTIKTQLSRLGKTGKLKITKKPTDEGVQYRA